LPGGRSSIAERRADDPDRLEDEPVVSHRRS